MWKPRLGFALALALFVCSLAFGQAGFGTFNGRVVDPSGAVIPGATVLATNTATGTTRTVTTNADGLYAVPALQPGVYDVEAQSAQFSSSLKKGVTLVADTVITLDFSLAVAGSSTAVTVESTAPLVETTQANASANLQHAEVQELPMLNRTLNAMISLTPGIRAETTDMNVPGTSTVHTYFNSGGNGRSEMELVDGLDNHDENDSGSQMQITLEAIQDVNIAAHGADAEFGRTGGAVAEVETKSGGNDIHGSAFGYGRSDALTKIDYFSDPAHGGVGKPPYSREQFGGSVGGPIKKNRMYFFGAVEDIRQNYTLPVPANIVSLEQYLTPAGGFPFNAYVLPSGAIPQPYHDFMADARFDIRLSKNNTFTFHFDGEKATLWNSDVGGSATIGPLVSAPLKWVDINHFPETLYQFSDTWVASPTAVNHFAFQREYYTKEDNPMNCENANPGGQGPALGLTVDQCSILNMNFPSIVTKNFDVGGLPLYQDDHLEFHDDVSLQLGKHAFKFGGEYIAVPWADGSFCVGLLGCGGPGQLTFFDDPNTIETNSNGLYPEGWETPGIVRSITLGASNAAGTAPIPNFRTYNMWFAGGFAQDTYKVTPRLSVNLGLRYDFAHNMNEDRLEYNRIYQALQAIGSPFGVLPKDSKLDFAPRVGFAWDFRGNGKDVIRANFGMYYPIQMVTSYFEENIYEQSVIPTLQTFSDTAVGVGPLASYVLGGPFPVARPPASTTLVPGEQTGCYENVGACWYAPNIRDQYEMISHIGWSHSIGTSTVVSVDYTHIQGVHEWRPIEINPICTTSTTGVTIPGGPAFQGPCSTPGPNGTYPWPSVAVGQRIMSSATQAVFGDPNLLGAITEVASIFTSRYNEMVVAFQHRSGRLTLQANYTLSYAYGYGGNVGGYFSSNSGGYQPETPSAYGGCWNCAGEWGPGEADERNRLVVFGVISLPHGFEISPSLTAASALPYSVFRANSPTGYGGLRCYVGPSCTTPGPTGQEVTVDSQRGDPLFDLSSRISRTFKLTESKSVTGFAEFYNITDRPNFGAQYGQNAFAPSTFEKPTGYIGGVPGSSAFTPDSFQVQLGARFAF